MKIQEKVPDILFSSAITENQKVFRSVSLVDQIANALRDDILAGRLKGGDQLLEDSLKIEFGISRTPLREAFRVLEKQGLVRLWRN